MCFNTQRDASLVKPFRTMKRLGSSLSGCDFGRVITVEDVTETCLLAGFGDDEDGARDHMVKLHCMAAVKRDAAGRVQKKLWLAKLKEHPRVNIGPARDGHDMIMAFAGDGVVRCTCRGDKTWNTGTVVNGNLAEHHKGGAAQASIMVASTMASATAKPDDEPAGAKKG